MTYNRIIVTQQGNIMTTTDNDAIFGNTTDVAYITERHKSIHKKNKISGHQWTEHKIVPGYEVVHKSGRTVCRTLKSAIECKNFWIKFHTGGFGV